jgi:hypothetical protein
MTAIRLSPATKRGLFSTLMRQAQEAEEKKSPHIETITMHPTAACGTTSTRGRAGASPTR